MTTDFNDNLWFKNSIIKHFSCHHRPESVILQTGKKELQTGEMVPGEMECRLRLLGSLGTGRCVKDTER